MGIGEPLSNKSREPGGIPGGVSSASDMFRIHTPPINTSDSSFVNQANQANNRRNTSSTNPTQFTSSQEPGGNETHRMEQFQPEPNQQSTHKTSDANDTTMQNYTPEPDYYKRLGVTQSSTDDEIKHAYRVLAKKYHPDVNPDQSAEDKRKAAEIIEAGDTLTNSKKKAEYDAERKKQLAESQLRKTTAGFSEMFQTIFGSPTPLNYESVYGKREPNDYFALPENDGLNLLQGLIKAYASKEDGMWDVRKSAVDTNPTVPTDLYVIERRGNQVIVYRKVTDWRTSLYKDKQYIESRYGKRYNEEPTRFNPNDYLAESNFTSTAKVYLEGVDVPFNYHEYLIAMKNLAAKIAYQKTDGKGGYDVAIERESIARFVRLNSTKYAVEGSPSFIATDKARKIPFSSFFDELRNAESTVKPRGVPKTNREGDK